MIKFIPKNVIITSPLSDIKNFTSNMANKKLASQLNKKFEGRFCSEHPDFENIMEVHFQKDGTVASVQSYCCDKFKQNLDLICLNKNPFNSGISDQTH